MLKTGGGKTLCEKHLAGDYLGGGETLFGKLLCSWKNTFFSLAIEPIKLRLCRPLYKKLKFLLFIKIFWYATCPILEPLISLF